MKGLLIAILLVFGLAAFAPKQQTPIVTEGDRDFVCLSMKATDGYAVVVKFNGKYYAFGGTGCKEKFTGEDKSSKDNYPSFYINRYNKLYPKK